MKRIFILVIFLSLISNYGCASHGPSVEQLKSPWDFGEIKKGGSMEKVFTIRNKGDETLVIDNIKACCGYSVLDISSWEIEPGEVLELNILSDTSRKNEGEDERKVTITSNDRDNKVIEIPVFSTIVKDSGE